MRVVIQRVSEASVKVDNQIVGEIGKGLMLLIGVDENDENADADWLVKKILDVGFFLMKKEK
jgi:D-tyrosyl-tRNA(Tyr) deacylase